MGALALPLMVASTVFSAAGAVREGNEAQASANYRAAQLDQAAGQTRTSAQRDAIDQRRQAALVASRLQAVAGGGGGDTTAVNLSAGIAGEGEYRALTALYNGEERALGQNMAADTSREEGRRAHRAGNMKAISSVLSSAGSMYGKFGGGGPGWGS